MVQCEPAPTEEKEQTTKLREVSRLNTAPTASIPLVSSSPIEYAAGKQRLLRSFLKCVNANIAPLA